MAVDTADPSTVNAPPRAYWFLSNLVVIHVTGAESEGRFSLLEFLMPADDATPLHVHRHESQTTYVLEGEVTFHLPGVKRVLRRGECIHQPAGVPQTEHVTSAGPARVLDIGCPAGFEHFVAAIGRPAPRLTLPPPARAAPDLDELAAVASAHGIELLGPPGALP
jgi:quercetin dioxygenase-like cupin family protein